jgi:hypothetical protein
MRRTWNLLAIAILLPLAACKPRAPADASSPIFQAPPEYGLAFNDDLANARLSFGAPNSDDVELIMACYKGSGRIMVTDLWQESAAVTARSGQAKLSYSGQISTNLESGGSEVEFWARPADPPLAAFRNTGELTLQSGKKSLPIKARPGEAPAVEAFFAACSKTGDGE